MVPAGLLAICGACVRIPEGATATSSPTAERGDAEHVVTVDGLIRTYLAHLPPALEESGPVPVVFVFHGLGQDGDMARRYTGFDALADEQDFIVVYPEGTGSKPSWNAGGCCGSAVLDGVDEVGFVRQILADLGRVVSIAPKRVYATGFSNGAMLTYRLACEMPDAFAAIAPVAGVLFYYGPCQPKEPVSVLHVHGLGDTQVPYAGNGLPGFGQQLPPVAFGIETWVRLDGCEGAPKVERNEGVTHTTYASCREGSAVELYTIDGWGHAWPTALGNGPSLSRIIWSFFAAHARP